MMLLTLIENAIKHGLGPLPRGGTLHLRATRNNETLRIEVSDNGAGLRAASGPGVGLSNTRARLTTLYGTNARLELRPNAAGGVMAAIEVPYRVRNEGEGDNE